MRVIGNAPAAGGAWFRVRVFSGECSPDLVEAIYVMADPCVPDDWKVRAERMFLFFVDADRRQSVLSQLGGTADAGLLTFSVRDEAAHDLAA